MLSLCARFDKFEIASREAPSPAKLQATPDQDLAHPYPMQRVDPMARIMADSVRRHQVQSRNCVAKLLRSPTQRRA